MARIAVLARRNEARVGVVGEDVRRLHTLLAVFAISHGVTCPMSVAQKTIDEWHLAHHCAWILDEPVARTQGENQVHYVRVYRVAEAGVFRFRCNAVAVMSERGDGVGCAVGRRPDDVGVSEVAQDFLGRQFADVGVEIDVSE